jgi:cell division protein FtsI/penicillin-binding protein 2
MNLPPFNRFQFIRIIAILMVVSILIQMVRIQTSASAQELPGLSSQYEYRTIYPERGNIYDRWGNLLAGNKEVYEIGVSLNEMQNQETVLTTIAGLTGADYMKMQTRIEEAKAGG